jgi:hypothetical protein
MLPTTGGTLTTSASQSVDNAHLVDMATFVHFVGENRFYRLRYPQLAAQIINDL